jgi:hypothetical protein
MWNDCVPAGPKKSNLDQELTPANRLLHGTSKNRSNNMLLREALSVYETSQRRDEIQGSVRTGSPRKPLGMAACRVWN